MQVVIGDAALLSAFAPLEAYPSAALAVSGGPDSMALMHLVRRWLSLKGREPASIAVLTVDHGLQGRKRRRSGIRCRASRSAGLRSCNPRLDRRKAQNRHPGGGAGCALRADGRILPRARYRLPRHRAYGGRPGRDVSDAPAPGQRARRACGDGGGLGARRRGPSSGRCSASPRPGSQPIFEASPFPSPATPATATPLSSACGCATP